MIKMSNDIPINDSSFYTIDKDGIDGAAMDIYDGPGPGIIEIKNKW